jgi:alkylated DNA repair dioxygenase AlkB
MQSQSKQSELFAAAREARPSGLVYQPEFITQEEEQCLLQVIDGLALHDAQYKQFTARRRIASFGGQYDFSRNVLEEAPELPPSLHPLRAKVARWLQIALEQFAHVLVAQYRPGTPLGWHRDVAQFELVVGVSLAGSARMRFRPYPLHANKREGVFALELEPRSAYILRDEARWRWQHSVPPTKELRYSITFRTRREGGLNRTSKANAEAQRSTEKTRS